MVEPDLAGGTTKSIQTWGTLNGQLINTIGAIVFAHENHPQNEMVEGSPWFSINGIPVCRMGDKAACGHPAIASQTWFDIS